MPHCWTVVFSRGLYDSKRKPGSKPPPPSKAKPTRPVKQPTYLRNQQIRSRTVRLILPDGANQIMPIADALAVAKSHNLDLVEISPQADPPVAKILDYSKLLHQQQQQQQEQERKARLKAKLDTPKEMHFTARIGDHDLDNKMRKVNEFLEDGYKVSLIVKHKRDEGPAASDAMDYFVARLQAERSVEAMPKQVGTRQVSLVVQPLKQSSSPVHPPKES
eukprot:jgi/Chrzof1/5547/Cz16g07040.t1